MTDPAGSDRIQPDVPTASGSGDDSSTGTSDLGLLERADPDGSGLNQGGAER